MEFDSLVPPEGPIRRCGFKFFPCIPDGKRPAVRGWQNIATNEPRRGVELWSASPGGNIGVVTGPPSCIFVLDVDTKNDAGGRESLQDLERIYGPLPPTLKARTPSGGSHFYFSYPAERRVRNRTGFKPGLDIRGEGGYVVAPPSAISGKSYEWIDEAAEVSPAPSWLLDLLEEPNGLSKITPVRNIGGGFDEGVRNDGIFRLICSWRSKGLDLPHARILAEDTARKCTPAYPLIEIGEMVERVYRIYENTWPCTDLGNAERFLETFGQLVRYVPETSSWIIWEANRWKYDTDNTIREAAKATVRGIQDEASGVADHEAQTRLRKHALQSQRPQALNNMLELASSDPRVVAHAASLDADDDFFGVANGVLELGTGQMAKEPMRKLVTMGSDVPWEPEAGCPNWLKFLDDVTEGDHELSLFLHHAIGYSMFGGNPEHKLFVLYGSGANGKSTFLRILQRLLGGYAKSVPGGFFMETRYGEKGGPREDLVRLRGARLIVSPEIGEGNVVNEELVKRITGDDILVARAPYAKHSIEFVPKFTPWISTNHKPIIRSDDEAIWRRVLLIPFARQFSESERNPFLGGQLATELPGILAWALQGYRQWKDQGRLIVPSRISSATGDYRAEMDLLEEWLEESCDLANGFEETFAKLYESYMFWCQRAYERHPMNRNSFGRRLAGKGLERRKSHGERVYVGIKLRKPKVKLGIES